MAEFTLSELINFIAQNGIWCALFLYLFITSKKESSDRENRLTTIVEQQGEKLSVIANTLNAIEERIERLEKKE